ncbi:MAG: hypothetical protein RL757_2045 [Bacteroidota bacterium]|jgi:outer membrane protein assembly factor BamD
MKSKIIFAVLTFTFWFGFPSCKNEFEKVRTSNDNSAMAKKADEYYEKGDWLKAQILYEAVMPSMRTAAGIERMAFRYSYTQYNLGNFASASFYFKNFATTYTNSPNREEADYMVAFSEYRTSPKFRLDQESTEKAIEGFQSFTNNYPQSKRVKECNRLIDELRAKLEEKAYDQGQLYFDMRQYQSAIQSFENMLKEYPDSKLAEQVRWRVLQSSFLFAENSILEKQSERFNTVLEKYEVFSTKFPKSKFREKAIDYSKIANQKIKELKNVRYQSKSTGS